MKIQTSGDQMQIKTGGVTMVVLGVVFVLVGAFATALPFLGITSDNGEGVPKWASLLGLIFVAVGVFAALTAKKRVITLVKNGESNINDTKMIGGGVKTQNFQTSDIAAVNLTTRNEYVGSGTDNGSTMQRRSDLHLILKDNSTVEVTSSSGQSGFSFNGMNISSLIRKAPLSREAEQISAFLGVPLKFEDVSNLQGLRDAIMGANKPKTTTPPINPNPPQPDMSQNDTNQPENKQTNL
jgi:hypothetical protein